MKIAVSKTIHTAGDNSVVVIGKTVPVVYLVLAAQNVTVVGQ